VDQECIGAGPDYRSKNGYSVLAFRIPAYEGSFDPGTGFGPGPDPRDSPTLTRPLPQLRPNNLRVRSDTPTVLPGHLPVDVQDF
jgi:hypothetical protein